MTAARGITCYTEGKDGYRFEGSRLNYVADQSLVTVVGNGTHPCYFNDTPVDHIEWDVRTNDIQAEVAGPATIQVNP